MAPSNSLIAICWLIFLLVWLIYSFENKKTIRGNVRRPGSWIRLLLFATIILLLNIKRFRQLTDFYLFSSNQVVQGIGVFICAAGIAFAIWARIHLGRNWGMPMALKEKPDLVTTGPYHLVRHPIYTGVCLAMIGSLLSAGFQWLIWLIFCSIFFNYSAKKEEKAMLLQFPEQYPAYMKRTKMLIPFIW